MTKQDIGLLTFLAVFTLLLSFLINQFTDFNSSKYLLSVETESVTSILDRADANRRPTTIIFVGDIMFDRYIRDTQGPGYENLLSSELVTYLKSSDGVVGNLEGSITNFDPVARYDQSSPDHYRFTFPIQVAEWLRSNNFLAVSIGNNHINDFGSEGIDQTQLYLSQADIKSFGDPRQVEDTAIVSINNDFFGLVAYNYSDTIPVEKTIVEIETLSNQVDYLIVFAHWGSEYESVANSSQISLARTFVKSGADLVVGAHPHVIQNQIMYKNIPVVYSLGNFIFDQYFEPNVRCGSVIKVEFINNSATIIDSINTFLESDGTTRIATKTEC